MTTDMFNTDLWPASTETVKKGVTVATLGPFLYGEGQTGLNDEGVTLEETSGDVKTLKNEITLLQEKVLNLEQLIGSGSGDNGGNG